MKGQSRRYLLLRIGSEVAPPREKLLGEIENSLRRLFGEYGVVNASLRLVAYDSEKMIGIVRCAHVWVERFRAALAMTTRISEHRAVLFILRSAGTVAALKRALSVDDDLKDRRLAKNSSSRTRAYSG